MVKPVRGSGADVRFREYRPLPDFLIATVKASMQPRAGTFTGRIRNITPDQDALGSPTTFAFLGENLTNARTVEFHGTLNHTAPARPDDRAILRVDGYRVKDMALSDNERLPITLREGTVDLDLKGSHIRNALSAQAQARVRGARFEAGGQDSFARSIASALSGVSSFTLTAVVSGTPDKYDVRISSDLDRVLKDAAGKAIRDRSAKVEKELRAAIAEKTGGSLKELRGSFAQLDSIGGALNGKQNQLNELSRDAQKAGGKLKLPF